LSVTTAGLVNVDKLALLLRVLLLMLLLATAVAAASFALLTVFLLLIHFLPEAKHKAKNISLGGRHCSAAAAAATTTTTAQASNRCRKGIVGCGCLGSVKRN
jgi:hypothetical protein